MNCPIDNTELRISERQGIEIDYCPQCRGVWLDRGELDKLIERASQAAGSGARDASFGERDRDRDRYDDDLSPRRDSDYERKRRRRSFLDDLFDFD